MKGSKHLKGAVPETRKRTLNDRYYSFKVFEKTNFNKALDSPGTICTYLLASPTDAGGVIQTAFKQSYQKSLAMVFRVSDSSAEMIIEMLADDSKRVAL
ncbi:MAG: hypothetical protein M1830_002889, partial [Pleopsidium flavum]